MAHTALEQGPENSISISLLNKDLRIDSEFHCDTKNMHQCPDFGIKGSSITDQ